MDASVAFMSYVGGIFPSSQCTTTINHGVTLVGYANGPNGYWIIRNSWNVWWGENGFARLELGNTCGILIADNAASV